MIIFVLVRRRAFHQYTTCLCSCHFPGFPVGKPGSKFGFPSPFLGVPEIRKPSNFEPYYSKSSIEIPLKPLLCFQYITAEISKHRVLNVHVPHKCQLDWFDFEYIMIMHE